MERIPCRSKQRNTAPQHTLKSLRLPQQVEKFPVDVLNHKMKDKIDISVFYKLYCELKTLSAVFITLMEAVGTGLELRRTASCLLTCWECERPKLPAWRWFLECCFWIMMAGLSSHLLAINEGEVRTSSEQKQHQYS